MKQRKTGKPKALEHEDDPDHQSPEEFAKEFFGDTNNREPMIGADGKPLPSLEELKRMFKTKSACIRYLFNLGNPPKVIAKHLGILYQHARNVCTTPLKRGPNEDWRPKSTTQPNVEVVEAEEQPT